MLLVEAAWQFWSDMDNILNVQQHMTSWEYLKERQACRHHLVRYVCQSTCQCLQLNICTHLLNVCHVLMFMLSSTLLSAGVQASPCLSSSILLSHKSTLQFLLL